MLAVFGIQLTANYFQPTTVFLFLMDGRLYPQTLDYRQTSRSLISWSW